MLWKTFDIADNEIGLLFRRERFEAVLEPGRHRVNAINGQIRLETYDITDIVFSRENAKFFIKSQHEKLSKYLESYELSDSEVGLFYRDGHLVDILSPGSFLALWKSVEKTEVVIIDISENFVVDAKQLDLFGKGSKVHWTKSDTAVLVAEVPNEHLGMLYVNGELQKLLHTGRYGFWTFNRTVNVKLVDLRLQLIEVSGQEILTRDRVSLRINLSASYKIEDAKTVVLKLKDYAGFIYRELQLGLREAVGTKTLDQLLEDKDALNQMIANQIREKMLQFGIDLVNVGVKDLILPGDMKVILNQVVEAQKEAEANLIRRKEETQAMRSLHNTAKVMENNPIILRLKELEALERISERIDSLSVYGGLDSVMNDLVKLKAN